MSCLIPLLAQRGGLPKAWGGDLFLRTYFFANDKPFASRAARSSRMLLGPKPCNFNRSASLTLLNCSSRV